jgi:hypothetical protein
MNKCGRVIVAFLATPGFLLLPTIPLGQTPPCDAANSKLLATSYGLAFSYPEQFIEYVEQHSNALKTMAFAKCIGAVIGAYQGATVISPSGQDIYERSMDVASRAGRPDLGPTVAGDLAQSQSNYAVCALLLGQLSQVLNGELSYESTLMYQDAIQRQTLRQVFVLSGGDPSFWEARDKIQFEIAEWFTETIARSVR